jgi:hypothetical protein
MSNSPIFECTYADAVTVRMTIWHPDAFQKLDLPRGLKLAAHAYRQRKGQEPPSVAEASFVTTHGMLLQHYRLDLFGALKPDGGDHG